MALPSTVSATAAATAAARSHTLPADVLGALGSGAALLLRPQIPSGPAICGIMSMTILLGRCSAVRLGLLVIVVLPLRCRRCCCRLLRLLCLCSHLPSLQTARYSR